MRCSALESFVRFRFIVVKYKTFVLLLLGICLLMMSEVSVPERRLSCTQRLDRKSPERGRLTDFEIKPFCVVAPEEAS